MPTSADLNVVNDVLHEVAENAMEDPALKDLLLDAPQLMGVESIELDTVNLRMVARTLPGKQYEVGRRIRVLVVRALRRAGIVSSADGHAPMVAAIPHPSETPGGGGRDSGAHRSRSSDLVVQGQARPRQGLDRRCSPSRSSRCSGCSRPSSRRRAPEAPAPAVVPPGFVPDPNYTWVPRTNVRRPKEADTTTTTPTTTTDRDDDAVAGHHEPHVADVADPDDDGGRSGRSGWPAGAADPDADTGLGDADHGRAGTGNGARHRRRRRDSPTRPTRVSPLHWRAVMITLDHVSKQYKSSARPALDNVSVKIDKGEFVFLIGPSGSGKSTFMRLLLAEDSPTKGDVRVSKFHVNKLPGRHIPSLRQVIGCVFQDFRLLQQKTVFENVAFALEVIGKRSDVINRVVPDVLEMVGLSGKANRLPGRAVRR